MSKKAYSEALDRRNRETAALLGAGIPADDIAKQQNISKRLVGKIRRDIKTDEDLRAAFETAQRETFHKVQEVAELALDAMKEGLQRPDCPVHHAAAAFRELAKSSADAMERVVDKGQEPDMPVKDVHALMDLLRQMFADERKKASHKTLELPAKPEEKRN